jgi:hypothetical protein
MANLDPKKGITPPVEESATANVTPLREVKHVADADDIESLWLDPKLGDGITDANIHTVAVSKPKGFFRVHPDPTYRRRGETYIHKIEGVVDETTYLIAPNMQHRIDEAQPCVVVTVVDRNGTPRLWVIKLPKDGKHDNQAWVSARSAAKAGMERWVRLVWDGTTYKTRDATPGYAPDPDFSKLPSFNKLVTLAFGEAGIIRDESHHIYRELFGIAAKKGEGDEDL